MQIVIDIPEELKNKIDNANEDNYRAYLWWFETTLYYAIKNGTVLPKGYGKLIDADAFAICGEYLEKLYGSDFYWEFKKQLDKQPTIIEADKTEREDKE